MSESYLPDHNSSGSIETPRLAFTINEVARMLSIGRTTVYALAKAGKLQLTKVGRRTLVTAAALDQFLQSTKGEA